MTGDAEQIIARIRKTRPLPVVVLGAADAFRLARALIPGGLTVTEVPLRSDTAAETIRRSTTKVAACALGAGRKPMPDHVKAAKVARPRCPVPARRFHRVQRLTVGAVAFAQAS